MNQLHTSLRFYTKASNTTVWCILFFIVLIVQPGFSHNKDSFKKALSDISDPVQQVEMIRHYTDSLIWNEFYADDDILFYLDTIIQICEQEDCAEAVIWAKAAKIDYQINTAGIQGVVPDLKNMLADPATQSPVLKAYIHQLIGMCFLMAGHSANESNHFLEGVKILEKEDIEERQLGMLYYYTAILYNYKSLADSCLYFGDKALNHFQERGDTIKLVLVKLAFNNWYLTVGDTEGSIKSVIDARDLSQEFELREPLHYDILVAMGLSYEKRKDYALAIETAKEGIAGVEASSMNAQDMAVDLWNFNLVIGRSYLNMNEAKKGLEYIQKSIKVCEDNDLYPSLVLISELFEVEAHLKLENFERANLILKDFIVNAENNPSYEIYNIKIVKLLTLLYKGSKTSPGEKELPVIKKIITRVIDKNKGKFNTNMLAAYELMALLQLNENRIDEAILSYDKINELKDSIWSQKKTEAVDKLLIEYKSKEQQQQIASQSQKLKDADRQRNLLIGFSIILFLFTALLYLFFRQRKRHVIDLEQKVQQRTRDLQLANKELEDSNEELERFAYITSHDLKEPLRNIISFTGLLETKNLGDDPNVQTYFGFIKESSKHMSQLIQDVLAFSILKKTHITKKNVVVNHIIEKVQYGIMNLIKEKNAQLKISELPNIKTDASMLYMVFKNLIENAIKYNKSKVPIVEVDHHEQDGFHWFSVRDNGIGVESDYYTQIFEMFKRLHSKAEYEGTGIGLAICKRVVKYLGGTIQIESTLGEGSVFQFSIPAEADAS